MVLFDDNDVKAAISDGFAEVMEYKLRAAAEEGEIFTPYARRRHRQQADRLIVLVEGHQEALTLDFLVEKVRKDFTNVRPSTVLATMGMAGLLPAAEAVARSSSAEVLVIADDEEGTLYAGDRSLIDDLASDGVKLIVLPGGLMRWLPVDSSQSRTPRSAQIEDLVNRTDIEELAKRDESFDRFLSYLRIRPNEVPPDNLP